MNTIENTIERKARNIKADLENLGYAPEEIIEIGHELVRVIEQEPSNES